MNTTNQQQWQEQARAAIAQGQSLNDFVSHCHIDNRQIARKAYKAAIARNKPNQQQTAEKRQFQRVQGDKPWLTEAEANAEGFYWPGGIREPQQTGGGNAPRAQELYKAKTEAFNQWKATKANSDWKHYEAARTAFNALPIRKSKDIASDEDLVLRVALGLSVHTFVTDPNVDPDCQHCDTCGEPKSAHQQQTAGQRDYEADLAKRPNYHDGQPRKTWAQLGEVEQWSWNRQQTGEGNAPRDKRHLYKTAKATIGCAYFKAGDFVSVKYYGLGQEGLPYFLCSAANDEREVCYPEYHLTQFCL